MVTTTGNVVLSTGVVGAGQIGRSLLVLFENKLRDGTVTASDETAGGEKENAYELGTTNDWWKPDGLGDQWLELVLPEPTLINSVGIAAHNLADAGGAVKVEQYDDSSSSWIPLTAIHLISNRRPYLILFGDVVADRIRVVFTGHSKNIRLGVVAVGAYMLFPGCVGPGYKPPYLNQNVTTINPVSSVGNLLGTSERKRTSKLSATIPLLDSTFVYGEYQQFADSAVQYPFFWSANDIDSHEVFYGRASNRPEAFWSTRTTMTARIDAVGYY